MAVFQPTRDEARSFLSEAWRKQRAGELLSPLEAITADVIAAHPEYHSLLEASSAQPQREFTPDEGEVNPFLHLHLHLAIAEQLSIDQPPGIRSAYTQLLARLDSPMAAQHALIDCLAEAMWRAQRDRTPPDGEAYLECIQRRATRLP